MANISAVSFASLPRREKHENSSPEAFAISSPDDHRLCRYNVWYEELYLPELDGFSNSRIVMADHQLKFRQEI